MELPMPAFSSRFNTSSQKKNTLQEAVKGTLRSSQKKNTLQEGVKGMLRSLADKQGYASAYDTAWVARIPSSSTSKYVPEFPDCLKWISANQHEDGSWGGDDNLFASMLSTLSCVIAMKIWSMPNKSISKGIKSLHDSMDELHNLEVDLPSGFQNTFPYLITDARLHGVNIDTKHPFLQQMTKRKCRRAAALEATAGCIAWDEKSHLQSRDGSFLASPASTACAYLHTKNPKCLSYLRIVGGQFNGAVPSFYPLDFLERLWLVDTIELLGIGHLFEQEICELLSYVSKCWSDDCLGGQDIGVTALAFKLFRWNRHVVDPGVFSRFLSASATFPAETSDLSKVLAMFRTSQLAFPDEPLLGQMYEDSKARLQDIIPGEARFEISTSWISCPKMVYSNSYFRSYDICAYRLPLVSNILLLQTAKEDFNACQKGLQAEAEQLVGWWTTSGFELMPFARDRINRLEELIVRIHFLMACWIPDPERSALRLVGAKLMLLTILCDDLADHHLTVPEFLQFIDMLQRRRDGSAVADGSFTVEEMSCEAVYKTVNDIVIQSSVEQGRKIGPKIWQSLTRFLRAVLVDAEDRSYDTYEEYMENARVSSGIENIVMCCIYFCGVQVTDELADLVLNSRELHLCCSITRLCNDISTYKVEEALGKDVSVLLSYMNEHTGVSRRDAIKHLREIAEQDTRELTLLYLRSTELPQPIKRLIFELARVTRFMYLNGKDIVRAPDADRQELIKAVSYEAL